MQIFLTYLSIDLDTQNNVRKQQAKANVCVFLIIICMHGMFLLGKRMTRAKKQKRERSRNSETNRSFIRSHMDSNIPPYKCMFLSA